MQASAPFFLAVQGEGAPKRPHDTLESAEAEADRLLAVRHKRVFILGTIGTREPTTEPEPKATREPVVKIKKSRLTREE